MTKLKHEIQVKEIVDIWRQIIIDFPVTNHSFKTMNTFAIVDNVKDSNHAALGKTYHDFLQGEFWAKDWVMSGANPNEIKKHWPVAMMELYNFKSTEIKPPATVVGCQGFYIAFEDLIECEACDPHEKRTPNQVQCDVNDMLLSAYLEFLSYAKFEEDGTFVWLSKDRYEQLVGGGANLSETNISIETFIDLGKQFEIKKWGIDYEKKRGASLQFSICGCVKSKPKFEYGKETPDKYEGTTKCSCC